MWSKMVNNEEKWLAVGDRYFSDRVEANIRIEGPQKGSTLVIPLAEKADEGIYICSSGSQEKQMIKHTVSVRGIEYFLY